jgi:Phosphotransferase enzyme family
VLDFAEATAWIDDRLARAGVSRTGPLEPVRVRPWGEVAKAESERGTVWFKEPRGATGFEVRLYELLADRVPDQILVPIAVDPERGWLLLPEGGASLGETAEGSDLAAGLIAALARYARLQRAVADDVDRMLSVGVQDMRPAAMPARFDEAVAAGERYVTEVGNERDHASLERVAAERGRFVRLCRELEDHPGGASLDHNDLHPWNILGTAGDPASLRFYDWGDSVVAHPFAAMLVPLGFAARSSDADLARARSAYLAEFADLGSERELGATLELACRVAKIARALTWERALAAASGTEHADDFARAPLESLESFLDESYLGWT